MSLEEFKDLDERGIYHFAETFEGKLADGLGFVVQRPQDLDYEDRSQLHEVLLVAGINIYQLYSKFGLLAGERE